MFGSKKRQEKREAARTAAVAERQEALAGFEKRAEEAAAMTDMGEKLFALSRLAEETIKRSNAEEKKVKDAGMNSALANTGGTIGSISILSGVAFGVGLLGGLLTGGAVLLPALGVAGSLGGIIGGGTIRLEAEKVPAKRGLYDQAFTDRVKEIGKKAAAEAEAILKDQYDALSESSVFGDVMKKYPSIKDEFTERTVKAAREEKKQAPKKRPDQQDFTL